MFSVESETEFLKSGSGIEEVESFSERLGVVLAKDFMDVVKLCKVGPVCWKERSEMLRVNMCGRSSER